jgi:ribosomal protein S27AE
MMAFVVHFSLVSSLNRYHPACAVKGPCVAVLACHSNRWACSGAGGKWRSFTKAIASRFQSGETVTAGS